MLFTLYDTHTENILVRPEKPKKKKMKTAVRVPFSYLFITNRLIFDKCIWYKRYYDSRVIYQYTEYTEFSCFSQNWI